MKLNLGCGNKQENKWVNIDIKNFGQEIIHDLRKPLPYKNKSVDKIKTTHFLEHLTKEENIAFLNECHRLLKKDGEIFIVVPSINHNGAYILQHKTLFNSTTFIDLERDDREKIYGIKKWKILNIIESGDNEIHCTMKPKNEN